MGSKWYMNGIYVGVRKRLYGKTALVQHVTPGWIMVQFDDRTVGSEAFGWKVFKSSDFDLWASDGSGLVSVDAGN